MFFFFPFFLPPPPPLPFFLSSARPKQWTDRPPPPSREKQRAEDEGQSSIKEKPDLEEVNSRCESSATQVGPIEGIGGECNRAFLPLPFFPPLFFSNIPSSPRPIAATERWCLRQKERRLIYIFSSSRFPFPPLFSPNSLLYFPRARRAFAPAVAES